MIFVVSTLQLPEGRATVSVNFQCPVWFRAQVVNVEDSHDSLGSLAKSLVTLRPTQSLSGNVGDQLKTIKVLKQGIFQPQKCDLIEVSLKDDLLCFARKLGRSK